MGMKKKIKTELERCYWEEVDGQKFTIPICGCSVHRNDLKMCSCYKLVMVKTKSKKETTIDEFEAECFRLRAINSKLNKENNRLWSQVFELKYKGLPLTLKREIESLTDGGATTLWALITRLRDTRKRQ